MDELLKLRIVMRFRSFIGKTRQKVRRRFACKRISMFDRYRERFASNNLSTLVLSSFLFCAVIFGLSAVQFAYTDHDANTEVRRAIVELRGTLSRVEDYEKQLRLKASQLDAALQEAADLDFDSSINPDGETPTDVEGGVGGGDDREIPLFVEGKHSLKSSSPISESMSVMELLDVGYDKLRRVPIGHPVEGNITSPFGRRRSPFTRRWQRHEGIDIGANFRSGVLASADGVVTKVGWKGAYGKVVAIDHGNGYETLYGHLTKALVKVGDKVCRGSKIGLVGSTGRSTGPHLHYEVIVNGEHVDPTSYMKLAGLLKMM